MRRWTIGGWCLVAALPAVALAQAGAELDQEGFVRDWLISGPWPSYQVRDIGRGLETDFLKPEDEAQPYPGKRESATFVADWGILVAGVGSTNEWGYRTNTTFDASWTVLTSDKPIVRMDGRFRPIDDYFVTYAACYVSSPRQQPARIAVGSDDDHKVFLDLQQIGKVTTSQDILPGNFKYDVTLPKGVSRILFKLQDRTGGCGFCLQLTDRDNKPLRDVRILTDVRGQQTSLDATLAVRRSPAMLESRAAAARKSLAAAQESIAAAQARQEVLSNACARAAANLREAYALRERMYAEEHAAAAAKGRRSVDEPFAPQACRASLCLNGRWESSVDGGKTWGRTYLPCELLNDYFYSWVYPVKGPGKPHPGFEDVFDRAHNATKATFRTTVDWDGASDLVLRCDSILGIKAAFSVNGTPCGVWDGLRGIVRIPLTGLRKGANVLTIATDRGRSSGTGVGINGDLWLEALPKVRVADVWIKPSWRRSALDVSSDLVNNSASLVTATVSAYAVKDGKVRFRLPERNVAIPAGGTASVRARDGWADPETWGIGGKFGEPNLYTLVTDVRVDGNLVDRHEEEFGFREFWICHTDFFLNGRRILLQGDVGHLHIEDKRRRDIAWPIYRADGINIIRSHDSGGQWCVTAARDADRMGMAMYAQTYPILPDGERATDPKTFPTWKSTEAHRRNLAAYTRWWKDFRNHPSVLIWSTDNEILTQAWDTEAKAAFNVTRDRIGAIYGDFMNELDPDLVVTRDGDVSTWNHQSRWYQDPPCRTANYHYPNYNNAAWAENWQATYEFRPLIFGEAIYSMYLQNGWKGGMPNLVRKKVEEVNRCAALYTALDVPCTVYMGLGLDGYTYLDETGTGNPWGVKASETSRFASLRRIPWPAYSGEGKRKPTTIVGLRSWGSQTMNFYEEGVPSHARNPVNDAYRKALRPQPPVDAGRFAEAVVTTAPNADVWTATPAGNRTGVRADAEGRAWFRSLAPGRRTFTDGARSKTVDLAPRTADVAKPGFVNLPRIGL